nr:tyrosine-type recombinase/integrase [Parablautia intestinalis]
MLAVRDGHISNSDIYRHWLPLFTVFLGNGCRVGEIIGLRWQDLDFESRTISINHNLIYRMYRQQGEKCEMHITTPKISVGCRTIPMLDEVRRHCCRRSNSRCREDITKQ